MAVGSQTSQVEQRQSGRVSMEGSCKHISPQGHTPEIPHKHTLPKFESCSEDHLLISSPRDHLHGNLLENSDSWVWGDALIPQHLHEKPGMVMHLEGRDRWMLRTHLPAGLTQMMCF